MPARAAQAFFNDRLAVVASSDYSSMAMEQTELTVNITAQDIVFECPNCGKSMVIDETATGMMIECIGCHVNVIIPSRPEFNVNDELLIAAQAGDAEAVRNLLGRAADVHARDSTGWTPLMRAAHAGNADVVTELLARGADVHSTTVDGKTALQLAEHGGHFQVVRQLWKAGAKS